MPRLSVFFAAALLAASIVLAAPAGAEGGKLLYILDASSSMLAPVEGVRRIDAAKQALVANLKQVPEGWHLGLVVYSHRTGKCDDVELVQPVAGVDRDALAAKVKEIQCRGKTPLANSLEAGGKHLQGFTGDVPKVIVLLSDGQETCGGDPVAVAQALRKLGIKLVIHVIGFAVDQASAKQLEAIATAGGGKYQSAKNQEELTRALKKTVSDEYLGTKQIARGGGKVRPGRDFGEAVEIGKGSWRSLAQVQKGQKAYFKIPVPSGHDLQVTFKTDQDWGYYVAANLYAGPNTSKRLGTQLLYKPQTVQRLGATYFGEGSYHFYLELERSGKGDIRKLEIAVELLDRTDAGTGRDVPEGWRKAHPIKVGAKVTGHIQSSGKDGDTYKIELKAKHKYKIRLVPAEKATLAAGLLLEDEDGGRLGLVGGKKAGFPTTLRYDAKEDATVFLTIGGYGTGGYTLKVTETKQD